MLRPEQSALAQALRAEGIETRPLFHPVHTMPMYAAGQTGLEVAVDLAARGMNLPSWPGLTSADLGEICRVIQRHFAAR